jgi:drug/metabolite transporter (DMT)-like permease
VIFARVPIKAESLTSRKIIGIFGAFVGVIIIFWHSLISGQGSTAQLSQLGGLAIVGSATSGGGKRGSKSSREKGKETGEARRKKILEARK